MSITYHEAQILLSWVDHMVQNLRLPVNIFVPNEVQCFVLEGLNSTLPDHKIPSK